jgi:PadR family transcriptional regulator PadR
MEYNSTTNLKTNFIEMLILHVLEFGDIYAYRLSQLLYEKSGNILKIPEGSLYPTLYRLVEKGFVSDQRVKVGKRAMRVLYHMEEPGKAQLEKLKADYFKTNKGVMNVLNSTFNE